MNSEANLTIIGRISQQASARPVASAIEVLGKQPLSYAELHQQIQTIARVIRSRGIRKEHRVVVVLPNGAEMAVVSLAVMSCAVLSPLNPEYKADEYAAYMDNIAPALLIAMGGDESSAKKVARKMGIPVLEVLPAKAGKAGQIEFLDVLQVESGADDAGAPAADSPALLLHTSGTTSRPKRVRLTHKNLLASANNLAQTLQLTETDICLHQLPMFHIGGLVDVLAAPLITGGKVICTQGFSIPAFVDNLQTFKASWTQTVPVMLQEILSHTDNIPGLLDNHTLRFLRSVSSPLPVSVASRFESLFRIPVIEIFGMTETAGQITSNRLPPGQRKPGSVGAAIGCELRVVDESGNSVAQGIKGEVVVRGSNVMVAYDEADSINHEAYFGDWLRTGDLGYLDEESNLYLAGRIKEIINRGGEKIAPVEVDEVVQSHPVVADAAVFTVQHDVLGEDIAVAVVLKTGQVLTRQALVEYAGKHLAHFKVPRKVYFVSNIPRSPSGKIQRFKLAELARLAETAKEGEGAQYLAAQDAVEESLAEMWASVLKRDRVGLNDDFFDLGGDSLKAASFINALQQKWGGTVYVSALFDAPTIAKFKTFLEHNYPELISRALGKQVFAASPDSGGRVTAEKLAKLKSAIVQTNTSMNTATSAKASKKPRAVFILSPPRSGSTLLRAILGGNPELFSPPELYLLSFNNLADRKNWFSGSQRFQLEGNTRCVMQLQGGDLAQAEQLIQTLEERKMPTAEYFGLLQSWMGNRLLVDKTPYYASHIETLRRAEEYFDNPLYIHLKRHPYGMIRSFEEAKLDQLWYPRLVGVEKAQQTGCPYTRRELAEMIWLILNQNIVEFLREVPENRQYAVKFEDLVTIPQGTVEGLCRYLGVAYDPEMLKPQSKQSERMTDGTHAVSRMIGDMKFHQHQGISAGAATTWKSHYEIDFLSEETREFAEQLGFSETIASANARKEFEF